MFELVGLSIEDYSILVSILVLLDSWAKTQGMFDALVDFVYNAGCGNFKRSTLLKRLNQKKYTEAAIEFGRWVYSNHRILNGLVIRRAHETTLFLS